MIEWFSLWHDRISLSIHWFLLDLHIIAIAIAIAASESRRGLDSFDLDLADFGLTDFSFEEEDDEVALEDDFCFDCAADCDLRAAPRLDFCNGAPGCESSVAELLLLLLLCCSPSESESFESALAFRCC